MSQSGIHVLQLGGQRLDLTQEGPEMLQNYPL